MKFNTIITLSAAAIFFQQVIAAGPTPQSEVNGQEVSTGGIDLATSSDPVMMDTEVPEAQMVNEVTEKTAPNTLEADLILNLGWSKSDTYILTSFLNAIDQMNGIVGEKASQELDQATVDMLAEFQTHAQQLMASAGYEFVQGADDRRVLTRISTEGIQKQDIDLADAIQKLTNGLANLLGKLKNSVKGNDVLTKTLDRIIGLVKTLGQQLKDIASKKPKSKGKGKGKGKDKQ